MARLRSQDALMQELQQERLDVAAGDAAKLRTPRSRAKKTFPVATPSSTPAAGSLKSQDDASWGAVRDVPCIGCIKSLAASGSDGSCHDQKDSSAARCARCSKGHKCIPVPFYLMPFVDELYMAKRALASAEEMDAPTPSKKRTRAGVEKENSTLNLAPLGTRSKHAAGKFSEVDELQKQIEALTEERDVLLAEQEADRKEAVSRSAKEGKAVVSAKKKGKQAAVQSVSRSVDDHPVESYREWHLKHEKAKADIEAVLATLHPPPKE
ncbi:hypothetical protein M406DRAFT_326824 [Cryphonectria parasitica EP155]|uniref:Uncharacterized protein n=1 Tax=Cryphonectria parasitica (strain ATCC 38755 / EP155) TaxID=660469 RepID=A0A9P5CSK4_CRYP1|nr:uncharacterized protein M406DRAFT_326824 [Cryphonectria parasitica EP155]KAF3768230.1 hypothetical protein M406DRAFT_326824 [Cryphonectria parasitica EP155]